MRLALEQLEPEKDMENFVRDYGTGNSIPELPAFVNYANTDAPPVSSTRVAMRPSIFVRSTQRTNRASTLPQDDDQYDDTNHAGVGAGGSGPSRSTPADAPPLSRSATQKSTSPRSQANGVNGHVSPSRDPQRRHSTALVPSVKPISAGDPVDPTVSTTQLVIGDRAWDVDPNKDPQQQEVNQARTSPPVEEQDPLVKRMAELNTAAAAGGTGRRNTIRRDGPPSVESRKGTGETLSTPPTTTSPNAASRDFRNSAEVVVGPYPLAQTQSRSASPNPPNPPKAVFAGPPPPSMPPSSSNIPVEQVVVGYQRTFPGESRSRANSYVGPPPVVNQSHDQAVSRPTSRGGYAGVGTQSLVPRSTSPAKGPTPTTMQTFNNRGPPAPSAPPSNGTLHRGMSISHRPVTPTNPVGIALGQDGRVVHDMMVQPVRQPLHYPQPGPPPQPTQPPQPYPGYHDRALTHPQQQQPPPPPRNDYVAAPNTYGGAQSYNYGHPPQHPPYDGHHGQPYPQPPPPPQPNYNNYAPVTRPPYHHQQNQSLGHIANPPQRYMANNAVYRPTSPGIRRSPSPAAPRGQPPPPTGTYTDNGRPILFYGTLFHVMHFVRG